MVILLLRQPLKRLPAVLARGVKQAHHKSARAAQASYFESAASDLRSAKPNASSVCGEHYCRHSAGSTHRSIFHRRTVTRRYACITVPLLRKDSRIGTIGALDYSRQLRILPYNTNRAAPRASYYSLAEVTAVYLRAGGKRPVRARPTASGMGI